MSPPLDHDVPVHRHPDVEALLRLALAEDLGSGDVTTQLVVPRHARARAVIRAKEPGVIAGIDVAARVPDIAGFHFDQDRLHADGDSVPPGALILAWTGAAAELLAVERVVLNILQRCSGIATLTRRYVEAVRRSSCAIMDTRKTVPGWRRLDKYAVRMGGGLNHRMGLYDQVLVKENHFALARGKDGQHDFGAAVADLMARRPAGLVVEVEVENLHEFDAAQDAGADVIMLDDMTLDDLREAVRRRDAGRNRSGRRPLLEASGGMTLDRVPAVAATGVDRISIGALTHSVKALDISMSIEAL